MDVFLIWLEFAVLLGCIVIGSRYGGVGLGL
jgi:anaerobic C4-dicarboxylate transporter